MNSIIKIYKIMLNKLISCIYGKFLFAYVQDYITKKSEIDFYNKMSSSFLYGADSLVVYNTDLEYMNVNSSVINNYWDLWLIYLSSLINLKNYQKVDTVFETFINKFNCHHLSEIKNFLPLSNYIASQDKYKDQTWFKEIRGAAHIYKRLNKDRGFLDICLSQSKSIAVVGNGLSHLGKNQGKEIDSHDIVVRFNNFELEGFEVDYGTKTDIWVRGSGGDDVEDRLEKEEFKLIVWEADYDHFKVHFNHLNVMEKYINLGVKMTNLDYKSHISLKQKSGIIFPTTGLMFTWYLFCLCGLDKVNLYGFSFQEEYPKNYNEHYFEKRDMNDLKERASVHNMNMENRFLNKLIQGEIVL